jgi:hypothetical protein
MKSITEIEKFSKKPKIGKTETENQHFSKTENRVFKPIFENQTLSYFSKKIRQLLKLKLFFSLELFQFATREN